MGEQDQTETAEDSGSAEGAEGAEGAGAAPEVSEEERKEIEEERERRLDPDNRPENTEIDNTDEPPAIVQEFDEEMAADDEGDDNGESDGGAAAAGLHDEPEQSVIDEIEQERERRLDPENRPENVEVDNTDRDFDQETGEFKD